MLILILPLGFFLFRKPVPRWRPNFAHASRWLKQTRDDRGDKRREKTGALNCKVRMDRLSWFEGERGSQMVGMAIKQLVF